MSESLFNRASKNFDKYLKAFQENGEVYMLPIERLPKEGWQAINNEIQKYGVHLIPTEHRGGLYMRFAALPVTKGQTVDVVRADSDLGAKLKRYTGLDWEHKKTSGLGYEHYRIKIDDMPQTQVQRIMDVLDKNAIYDANVVYTNKGQYLIVKKPDSVLDSVLDYYKTVMFHGVPAYVFDKQGMSRGVAEELARRVTMHNMHYANVLNKEGHTGADHILIVMKKSDAEKIGAKYQDGNLYLKKDDSTAEQNLSKMIGVPLTHINGVPAVIESMDDFGVRSGRPIVLVKVGNKKLPFYISTGTAGKTDVPAGRWEFFAGIASDGWFRKGDLQAIVSHYGSPELKQIADALDSKIGDMRGEIDVLKTIGRASLGGQGAVAVLRHGPEISRDRVNKDIVNPDNEGIYLLDIRDIKKYLHNLMKSRSKAQDLEQGTENLKSRMLARLSQLFKGVKTND